MDDLNCDGTENDISACNFRGWDKNNCGHSEDVGLQCRKLFLPISYIFKPTTEP